MEDHQRQLQYVEQYLSGIADISKALHYNEIENMVDGLVECRNKGGRIFCIGVGGGAANASHAVNDFRKLCEIESYAPTDNIAELTARTNDEGWETIFSKWLEIVHIRMNDVIFIFSVGGGSNSVSKNIYEALRYFSPSNIYGIVGRDGGYTKYMGDNVIVIPTINPDLVTAYTESFQMILLHCIVFHPKLLINKGKWESINEY